METLPTLASRMIDRSCSIPVGSFSNKTMCVDVPDLIARVLGTFALKQAVLGLSPPKALKNCDLWENCRVHQVTMEIVIEFTFQHTVGRFSRECHIQLSSSYLRPKHKTLIPWHHTWMEHTICGYHPSSMNQTACGDVCCSISRIIHQKMMRLFA